MFATSLRGGLTAVAATLLATLTPAHAGQSIKVGYGDVDLTSAKGAQIVERRLRSAAATVCGDSFARDLTMKRTARACRTRAIAAAQTQLEVAIARAENGTRLAGAAVEVNTN